MYRFSFLVVLGLLVSLLTACPAEVTPLPCTGASCPTPTVCDANPGLAKQSASGGLTVSSSFKACYKRGASDAVSFKLTVDEAIIPSDRVIFVVDIVTEDSQKNTDSVVDQFFNSQSDISVTPNIFVSGASKAELVAGLDATINFKFKSTSPVGEPYYFVISLFRFGGNTKDCNDLIGGCGKGRIIYKFKTADQ
jgi:hypothetical protein